MSTPLVPCPGCRRHVRASEVACPFCSSALPDDLVARAIPTAPRRLSRAAAMAFASTITVGAAGIANVACSSEHTGDPSLVDSGSQQAAYGAPIFDTAPPKVDSNGSIEAATDTATAPDVSTDTKPDTGGEVDTGSFAGAYGLPPSDGG